MGYKIDVQAKAGAVGRRLLMKSYTARGRQATWLTAIYEKIDGQAPAGAAGRDVVKSRPPGAGRIRGPRSIKS